MARMIMTAVLATTLMAGAAVAQSTNDSLAPKPSAVPEAPTAGGAKPGHTVVAAEATDLMASKLMGLEVYNRQDQEVGKIADILFNPDLTPRAVVLGVGGMLGISKRQVLVDPATLHITPAGDGKAGLRARLDTDSKDLQDAPQFKG